MSIETTGVTGGASGGTASPGAAPSSSPTPTPGETGALANTGGAPVTTPGATPSLGSAPTPTPGPNYEEFFTNNGGYERVQLTSKLGSQFLAPDEQYKIDSFLDQLYELSESRYIDAVNKIATDHPEAFQSQLLSRMSSDEALRQSVLQNLGWNEQDYNNYRNFLANKPNATNPTLDPRDQKIAELERQNNERIQRETFAKHEQAFGSFTNDVNAPIAEIMKSMSFPMDQSGQLTEEGKNAQRAFQALTGQILSENQNAQKLYEASQAHFGRGEYQLGAMNQVSLKAAVKDAATQASKQIGQWMAASAELAQLKAKMNGTTTEPALTSGAARGQAATPNVSAPAFDGLPGYGKFSAENMRAELKAKLNSR